MVVEKGKLVQPRRWIRDTRSKAIMILHPGTHLTHQLEFDPYESHMEGFELLLTLAREIANPKNEYIFGGYGIYSEARYALRLLGEELE